MIFTPTVDSSTGAFSWQCSSDSIEESVLDKLKPSCQFEVATVGNTMMRAIYNQDTNGLKAALANGADRDDVIRGSTPLLLAAKIGDLEIVDLLLDAGVDVDRSVPQDEQQTPLMVAINNDHEHVVRTLLVRGASLVRRDYRGLSALDHAISKDQELGGRRYVLQISASMDPQLAGALKHSTLTSNELLIRENQQHTYYKELRQAAIDCHVLRIASLFEQMKESDVNELVDGHPLQHHTQKPRCSAVLTNYIRTKPVFQSAVHARFAKAVRECGSVQMQSMLKNNDSLNVQHQHGGILHIDRAIKNGCVELVTILKRLDDHEFQADDDVLVRAIRTAPQSSMVSMIVALIEAGANINIRDAEGRSPLVASISFEQPVLARYLITAGASTSGLSGEDFYPIVEASKKGYARVVQHLIKQGVDVQDRLGRTALMAAVNRGHYDLVSALLDAGADVMLEDLHRVDAVVLAQTGNHKRIKSLLLSAQNQTL